MNEIVEKMALHFLKELITPEIVAKLEAQFVQGLYDLAKKSPTTLDEAVVKLVAQALGVPDPV